MKSFIKNKTDGTPIQDNVFRIVGLANKAIEEKGKDKVINGTIGSLFDEDGNLVALKSVFEHYNQMPDTMKAKYASGFAGNPTYRDRIYTWLTDSINTTLAHAVVGTPGGSGAVSETIDNTLDIGETLILPDIAWSNYQLMAEMDCLKTVTYSMFDGDAFNVASFKEVCEKVMEEQGKVVAVINDPCHNPTGYSLTKEEWDKVVEVMNECGKKGPFILLNDIAYIDYSYDFENSRKYMETWNNISDNVMVVIAFSCSKTMTSYGLRCGAAVILAKQQEAVRELEIVLEKCARAIWSNINNSGMENFVYVTTDGFEDFHKEKAFYVDLLRQRSSIFLKEADACGLEHYPYKEGFFVTLKIEDKDKLQKFHQALLDRDIYTIEVNKGIRVAMCSMNIEKVTGLAPLMKEVLDSIA